MNIFTNVFSAAKRVSAFARALFAENNKVTLFFSIVTNDRSKSENVGTLNNLQILLFIKKGGMNKKKQRNSLEQFRLVLFSG